MLEIRSFRDLLRLFFIFRREFQWAVIFTVVVAVLGAFLLPAKYESNARLLVKPGRDNTTMPIEVSNRQALIAPSTQRDPIVDEEKMLTGRPIVRMVAERYFEEMAGYRPQGFWKTVKFHIGRVVNSVLEVVRSGLQMLGIVEEQTPVERLAKKLEKQFEVGHEPGSAVIEISFTWNDPLVAQKVVEFWVESFLQERTRALGRKSLYDFYEGETVQVATRIGQLKEQLQGELKKIDSISVQERLENLTTQINRLVDSRVETQSELAGIESFLAQARTTLKKLNPEVVTAREISLNPTQLDLKRQLNALNLERTRLLRTFLPDAPPVQDVEANIKSIEELVATEQERLERSQNRAPNSLATGLMQQIQDAELRQQQLQGQLLDQEQHIERLRLTRQQVLGSEPALTRLTLELEAAEKSYALYTENLEKARIDRELDNSQISNIAQIEQATFNPSRVFPKSLLILLMALPAGLAVGLLTLYLLYLLDQRIHDGAKVEEVFGVPLWSSVPDIGPEPVTPTSAFIASIYRLYGLIPLQQVEESGYVLALTSARHGEGVSFIQNRLRQLLEERGYKVRLEAGSPAQPGEIVLLDASALLSSHEAFVTLRRANQIVLVVEAGQSTIPMVQSALSALTTAFKKVDGIILNKRRFEVPERVLRVVNRLRTVG